MSSRVGSVEPRGPSASSTLRAVLCEYVLDRHDSVSRSTIVAALRRCGLSSDATRQALSRAIRGGALQPVQADGHSELAISPLARDPLDIVKAYSDLVQPPLVWDGTWSMIIVRGSSTAASPHAVRNALLTEGMGQLSSGLWVTPHSARSERTVRLLQSDPALDVLSCRATFDEPSSAQVAQQSWDLEGIRARYDNFSAFIEDLGPSDADGCFVAWTSAVREWQQLMHADPGLPVEAVGDHWPASRVRAHMAGARDRWRPLAQQLFDQLVTESQQPL